YPTRDESVNIGVVVVADDRTFADAHFGDLSRVRRLNPRADLKSIEMFVDAVRSKLPTHGRQTTLEPARDALSAETMQDWSREFGGLVRLSPPRVMLAREPDLLVESLFKEMVAPVRADRRRTGRVVGRADILHNLD